MSGTHTSGDAEGTPVAVGAPEVGRFAELPERIPLEQMVPGKDVTEAPDPAGGRDNETEFMLRHM